MPGDRDVLVTEVGLRDGLQLINLVVDTQDKMAWCTRAAAAGIAEMEVTALVPPRVAPQFFDAAAMIAHGRSIPGLLASALVPNLEGARRGIELGCAKLVYVISASESFNQANLRRSRQGSLDDLRRVVGLARDLPRDRRPILVGGISAAFGCAFEGRIRAGEVAWLAEALLDAGVDELVLADTSGSGDPAWVREILGAVLSSTSESIVGAHFHDTRGTGLANVLAALDCGIRRFDASLGGIGGCPNSPGATGNIATEDLVYMLEAMGLTTGIDLGSLIALRLDIAAMLPTVALNGKLSAAGLPTGFSEFRAVRSAWTT